jgi:cell division protein FtsQ
MTAGKRKRRKKINMWIPAIILVLAGAIAGMMLFVKFQFRITKINITGSDKYTYDELYSYIFKDRNDSNMLLFKRSHKKAPEIKIPFIAKVTIETDWPGTLNITVYEKSMIGYVLYQGAYMYFDKDGVVVESSGELVSGIPKVEGLDYSSIVLYNTLDVSDESVFPSIMNLKQYLDKYEIGIEEIRVSEDTKFSIDIGEITVLLGHDDDNMSKKIFELSCMLGELEGKRGTLDMEEYTEDSQYIILTEK